MKHSFSYEVNKLKPLKLILLAVAILIDLVLIFTIPSIIFEPKVLFLTIGGFILNLLFKMSTIYLTYTIEYFYYDKKLVITKRYYRKKKIILEINKSDVLNIEKLENNSDALKIVNDFNCIYENFSVETKSGKYILSLDNTLISALLCEDKYDLFR